MIIVQTKPYVWESEKKLITEEIATIAVVASTESQSLFSGESEGATK